MTLNEIKTPLDQLEYDLTAGPLAQLILLTIIYDANEEQHPESIQREQTE